MAEKAKVPQKATAAALAMMGLFAVLDFDAKAASVGGNLHAQLSNHGLTIGERDSMIAGSAIVHNLIVITDNTREFVRVPGLEVENWRV